MSKRISLKDIAEHVGVSTTLVSYVLNGKLTDRINRDTAARIKKAAKEMNYRPNQIARSLKIQKTKTIGLVVSDISNPFSSTIARIIEHEAKKNDYYILFTSAGESADKASGLIDVLLSRQVDGLIIAPPPGLESKLMRLKKQGIAFVLIDRYFPQLKVNSILIDNHHASFNAVVHLIENGYQNIGMINYNSKLFNLIDRKKGYIDAMMAHGQEVREENIKVIDENNLEIEVKKAIDDLLKRVDALFFTSNRIAIEGLAYLGRLRVRIPEELGIVSFDDNEALKLFPTEISVVSQPHNEIGKEAIKLLLETIANPKTTKEIYLQSTFIERSSSIRQN